MIIDLAIQHSDMAADKLALLQSQIQKAPEGISLEIGTRMGGSAHLALAENNISTLISVDPYGQKPYIDRNGIAPFIYPDNWYMETVARLCTHALELKKQFITYKMESLDFLNADFGIWLNGHKTLVKHLKFNYILLDGEHNSKVVNQEIEILKQQLMPGGVMVLDNADWLDDSDLSSFTVGSWGMYTYINN